MTVYFGSTDLQSGLKTYICQEEFDKPNVPAAPKNIIIKQASKPDPKWRSTRLKLKKEQEWVKMNEWVSAWIIKNGWVVAPKRIMRPEEAPHEYWNKQEFLAQRRASNWIPFELICCQGDETLITASSRSSSACLFTHLFSSVIPTQPRQRPQAYLQDRRSRKITNKLKCFCSGSPCRTTSSAHGASNWAAFIRKPCGHVHSWRQRLRFGNKQNSELWSNTVGEFILLSIDLLGNII